jgi:hypothetical protein
MPTPNGLITPTEVADEELRNVGVEGYIDPVTKLLLPKSEESLAIIQRRLSTARAVHPTDDTPAKRRRTAR